MKKKILLVLILPLLIATQCDEDDVCPGLEEFQGFSITVENTQAVYNINETIWLSAAVSSTLFNTCTDTEEEVSDPSLFIDSIFIVKLVDSNTEINSQITEATTSFNIGSQFMFSSCNDAVNITPVIVDDGFEFFYRLGIQNAEAGDYCIVSGWGRSTTINDGATNNLDIYEAYNNGENTLKFDNCGQTYTRTLEDAIYFFSVE